VVHFGKELRALPFKVQVGRKLHFQALAPAPTAKRGLIFSGQQWDKVISGSGSSSLSAGRGERVSTPLGKQPQGMKMAATVKGSNKAAAASDAAEVLAIGVQKMAVHGIPLVPSPTRSGAGGSGILAKPGRERVSGIYSFFGSSD
jgi:hypothetical protein